MVMFDPVFETFRQVTEASLHVQQEMFKKAMSLWTGFPAGGPPGVEQVRQFQKKWAEYVGDLLKRQRQVTEAHFKAGLESIEKAFHLGEAKSIEEMRARTLELWQKLFESFKQAYEAQIHEVQGALEKWTELVTKPAA
jgi:hypothetical protein